MSVTRADLKSLKRILVKVGTSVIIHSDGTVALARMASLVEQISYLQKAGKEVILVTSGAVGIGKNKLHTQSLMATPLRNHIHGGTTFTKAEDGRAAAAAGQSTLMALYENLFGQKQVAVSQILVTDEDFASKERRENFRTTLNILLSLGVIPILNENDVISIRKTPLRDEGGKVLWDNDSLSMLVSHEVGVELMVLLSDVEGLYKSPPDPNSPIKPEIIHTYFKDEAVSFNTAGKSRTGRGGMQAKIDAALAALSHDVKAVVIASGYRVDVVKDIIEGKKVGTLLVSNPERDADDEPSTSHHKTEYYQELATNVRNASRCLNATLSASERSHILKAIADALMQHKDLILDANQRDVEQARLTSVAPALQSRLVLNEAKLKTLVTGIRQVADSPDPIGLVLSRTRVSEGLELTQESVPIGVLLVIFESRPDVLPQVVSLALRSGNGLILKGGKEASRTNTALHTVIVNAIEASSGGKVPKAVVSLVETRQAIDDLLKLDSQYIDLVIPRGSNQLVRHIQNNTRIPVLGHAEGVCHVFVDKAAKLETAVPVLLDSKTDYPSACNSVETLLLHSDLPRPSVDRFLNALRQAKVEIFGGPKAAPALALKPAASLHHEYSDLAITVEFVDSVGDAIHHINAYGSSHTDCIITEDEIAAKKFLNDVDSACVFHNCSTRFADGFRFGLGAEVGISTGRIHARGPVGIDGLTTTKWKLVSTSPVPQVVSDYSKGVKQYVHKSLPVAKL